MKTYVNQNQMPWSRAVANSFRENKTSILGKSILKQQFNENHTSIQQLINETPRMIIQRKQIRGVEKNISRKKNRFELPHQLKTGIEHLSGYSMDDVKVHYNSSKPALVQALAYTRGTDIYVAPGQEKYLPHEAWHAVQQKQGRVRPTIQRMGISINNSPFLEQEADVMGARSLKYYGTPSLTKKIKSHIPYAVQCFIVYRSGGASVASLTPKSKDLNGNKRGLSTFEFLDKAAINITNAQLIETDKLNTLQAIRNGNGPRDSHVSIRPNDDALLAAWSISQHDVPEDQKYVHTLTEEVQAAIVGKRSKNGLITMF